MPTTTRACGRLDNLPDEFSEAAAGEKKDYRIYIYMIYKLAIDFARGVLFPCR